MGNLRAHEDLRGHQENVARLLRVEQEVASLASTSMGPDSRHDQYQQATVEDCLDVKEPVSWYDTPAHAFASDTSVPGKPDAESRRIPPELQRALDGEVPFSSGDPFVPFGAASITLEDVLGGAGLFRRVMGIEEESPLWDSGLGAEGEDDELGGITGAHPRSSRAKYRLGGTDHGSVSRACARHRDHIRRALWRTWAASREHVSISQPRGEQHQNL